MQTQKFTLQTSSSNSFFSCFLCSITGVGKRWSEYWKFNWNKIIKTYCRRVLICINEVLFPILHAAIWYWRRSAFLNFLSSRLTSAILFIYPPFLRLRPRKLDIYTFHSALWVFRWFINWNRSCRNDRLRNSLYKIQNNFLRDSQKVCLFSKIQTATVIFYENK